MSVTGFVMLPVCFEQSIFSGTTGMAEDKSRSLINKSGKVQHLNHHSNGSLYTYIPGASSCKLIQFKVGLFRPDWMQNGTYKGQKVINGRNCDMWALSQMLPPFTKPFLAYYDDALTGAIVREVFFVGVSDTMVELSPGVMGSDELFKIRTNRLLQESHTSPSTRSVLTSDLALRW